MIQTEQRFGGINLNEYLTELLTQEALKSTEDFLNKEEKKIKQT